MIFRKQQIEPPQLDITNQHVHINIGDHQTVHKVLQILKLGESDLKYLKAFKPIIEKNIDEIVRVFYDALHAESSLIQIINDNSSVNRLKVTLTRHIQEMFEGKLDPHYFEQRKQIASKDFYGVDNKNEFDESIYLEKFTLSKDGKTQSLQARDFDEQFSKYENSKVVKVIYEDNYKSAALSNRFSFEVERVKKELIDLAADAMPAKQLDVGDADIEALQQKLAQSVLLEMPYSAGISRNAANYFKAVEQAISKRLVGYDAAIFEMIADDKGTTYNRASVDALIYDFYGLKMNSEEFNHLASDEGYMVDEEKYYGPLKATQDEETYVYRQLLAVKSVNSQYDAVKFTDYEMPQTVNISATDEHALIAGEKRNSGYVLFKRLPFKSGVKWIYIDTVDQLDNLNTEQYTTYENSLDIIQKLIAEQKTNPIQSED